MTTTTNKDSLVQIEDGIAVMTVVGVTVKADGRKLYLTYPPGLLDKLIWNRHWWFLNSC